MLSLSRMSQRKVGDQLSTGKYLAPSGRHTSDIYRAVLNFNKYHGSDIKVGDTFDEVNKAKEDTMKKKQGACISSTPVARLQDLPAARLRDLPVARLQDLREEKLGNRETPVSTNTPTPIIPDGAYTIETLTKKLAEYHQERNDKSYREYLANKDRYFAELEDDDDDESESSEESEEESVVEIEEDSQDNYKSAVFNFNLFFK